MKKYHLLSFLAVSMTLSLMLESCKKEEAPEVTTSPIVYATAVALGGGNVTSDGGASIGARGVCWNETGSPTTADDKSSDGSGTGSFTSQITGLTPNTTYFARAYATNSEGTSYGSEREFTTYGVLDSDDNGYHTVVIGTQEWMKENLKTTSYGDGSAIPKVTGTDDWINAVTGAYCEYDNDENNVETYGRLYNWFAVVDERHVCPDGWRMPTLGDFETLATTLGGLDVAGGKMKSTGTLADGNGQWNSPNTGATNSSGFTGLPGGTRWDNAVFTDVHSFGHWWTPEGGSTYAWGVRLQEYNAVLEEGQNYSYIGHSVRCIKQ